MTTTIITVLIAITFILAIGWYLTYLKLWRKTCPTFPVVKKRKLPTTLDLELATTHQVISELAKRPNYRFLMLVPHTQQNTSSVEIHASNVSTYAALEILRATCEGIEDTIRRDDTDDLDDF